MSYDLIVVGSGPAGHNGAMTAAKLHKKVAIVERSPKKVGGASLHQGTIPSKTIREAILHMTGCCRQRSRRGQLRRETTMGELCRTLSEVTEHELNAVRDQLERNGVDTYGGRARFVGPHTVEVEGPDGLRVLEGDKILIACGTRPARPAHIPFDGKRILDSDEILNLERIPRSMIVVGAGMIGLEYAIMFAALGVAVTLVDGRKNPLDFCDREIVELLLHHARTLGMSLRLGEEAIGVERLEGDLVGVRLENGKRLVAETALFSVGRIGRTDELNLPAAGLEADERGRLWCNEDQQTWLPHIYGCGDVVGFPALASVSMEQGRRAVSHAFGQPFERCRVVPYGLFTIPEISMVGKSEQHLEAEGVPYEVGLARFSDTARGQILGNTVGMLKLLFHRETRELLGVHCIGETATEIIHIGQTVMAYGGTVDYFRQTVYNFPTMAECYRLAACDGLEKLELAPLADSTDGVSDAEPSLHPEAAAAPLLEPAAV